MDLKEYQPPLFKETKLRSQRDEYIQKFLEKINPARVRDGIKEMSIGEFIRRVDKRFQNSDAGILYLLYKRCEGFDDFSKGFHYLTRVK